MMDALLFLCVLFSPFLLASFAVLMCVVFGIDPTDDVPKKERTEMKGIEE